MGTISKHITYAEATHSYTAKKYGIDNTPTEAHLTNMVKVAEAVFEPLREHFGKPIYVSSFFRSAALNKKLPGAKNSQHLANNGAAIDIDADMFGGLSNTDIFEYIKDNLEFDQLIAEHKGDNGPAWVHVSFNEGKNRKQILIATRDELSGKEIFLPYSPTLYKELYGQKD